MKTIRIKAGHVQPVWAGHPWIYPQAIASIDRGIEAGDEIAVVDPTGNFLGRGFYSPRSSISVRLFSRAEHVPFEKLIRDRIDQAIALRRMFFLPSEHTDGYRLLHAEGDLLPGLIVDRFGEALVVQLLTIGMKRREQEILDALQERLSPKTIFDRTPLAIAHAEGFSVGNLLRGDPTDRFAFSERGLQYRIPCTIQQKTGFYFDQRRLRERIEQLSKGARVLDAYSFVGSFAMAAARGGAARVTAVDRSPSALETLRACATHNELGSRVHCVQQDARTFLETTGEWDIVLLDPPPLAPARADKKKAIGAYAKLAELGCRTLGSSGLLVFSSCSSVISLDDLTRASALGASRASSDIVVLERFFQGEDHPVPAAFPEGLYLKSLVMQVCRR